MQMFVPQRLKIHDRPEIDVLPLNVLFAASRVVDGRLVTGAAIYAPDMSTLQVAESKIALTYRNLIDMSWIVVIEFNRGRNSWVGTKSMGGKTLVYSTGTTWDGFFKHLTLSGLKNGEPCRFLETPENPGE